MLGKIRLLGHDTIGWLTFKLVRTLLILLMRVKRVKLTATGKKLLPRQGPYILAIAPHTSFFDGPVMFAIVRRRFVGVGMAEMLDWQKWHVFSLLFRMMGHIPVQRDNKQSRDHTLTASIATLRRGVPVFIATEGGIDRDSWRDGYARMAWETKAPIVLVKLFGIRNFMDEGPDEEWIFDFKAPIHVAIGAVLDPHDFHSADELHAAAMVAHATIAVP